MNISVAIPAKDEEDNIGDCLGSLTAQLRDDDELIVLDNGSTDRTAAIADSYDGVRVIDAPDSRFSDRHYRGLSQLRQLGAEEARNEIVATTDADTCPRDDWLDRIRQHFEEDPDLSVLWGVVTDTNGVPVRDMTGKYLTFLGGVSGCNTAFRKSEFEQLKKGYVGWPMFEDVALITRLSRTGKAKHDRSLVMDTDLDRRRYQTIPMTAGSAATIGSGALVGGTAGAALAGVGAGVGGTEMFYEAANEAAPDGPFHHDQTGFLLTLGGLIIGGRPGLATSGVGVGMLAHHVLTEGISAVQTDLMLNTDEVCRFDPDEGMEVVCEPADATESKLTRVIAATTAGGVAGKALQLALG